MAASFAIPLASDVVTALAVDLRALEAGVPVEVLTRFSEESGVSMRDLYDVVIPARTLKHRRSRNEALSRDETDKLARVVRLFKLGGKVFGDPDKARRWLLKPKIRFEGRTPLNMMQTETGGRMVEEMLIQIDEGMFA